MKIELPHRTLYIKEEDKNLTEEEKMKFVNSLLEEEIVIRDERMTLEFYLAVTQNASTSYIKEQLAYFLIKEHRVKQDIITKERMKKMRVGGEKSVPFSSVSHNDGLRLGTIESFDEYE